jgi:peptidoglycan/xylan/chitin deacetylase (PgdA/CDA1 family)
MSFALTFDDGPGPSTPGLLDVLRDARVSATFFVLGRSVEEAPGFDGDRKRARALVVRALQEGHEIGNHSYTHAERSSKESFIKEIDRVDALIRELQFEAGTPTDRPIMVRCPYGRQGIRDPRGVGLDERSRWGVGWDESFADWMPRTGDEIAREMSSHVARSVAAGGESVLLLHDGGVGAHEVHYGYDRTATVAAVKLFLADAAKQGWRAVSLRSIAEKRLIEHS